MGMIRKALFAGTLGAVAPSSKKQRVARQTLAAVQGRPAGEVARTGTRRGALYGTAPRERHSAAYRAAHVPGSKEYRALHSS